MLLAAAIIVLVLTVLGTFLCLFAQGMSDAPSDDDFSWWPPLFGVGISVALFAAWWVWGGSAVTW